jgi:hypothetical protein
MRWVRGDVCVWWGRRKKKDKGVHGWWEKKINKKEKRNGKWGLRVWWEKRGVEKKEEKKFEREKTKLVLFVCLLCLVQSVEL